MARVFDSDRMPLGAPIALGGEARDRPNRAVSLKDIAEKPVLADMAELLHRKHAEEPLAYAHRI